MNKATVDFFGRKFDLGIVFDCYEGEDILSSQKEALQSFLESPYILDDDLKMLKNYCLKCNKKEIGEKIENIFKYVIPVDIYVGRENDKIAIMCKYKYDLEHGLALIYKDKELKEIGPQDIVL